MNIYTLSDIISYLDNDSKIVCNRINNNFRNIIGTVKWYHDKKAYNKFDVIDNCRDDAISYTIINILYGQYNSQRLRTYLTRVNCLCEYDVMTGACSGGQNELVREISNKKPIENQYTSDCDFMCACEGCDKETIDAFLNKGKAHIENGLYGACIGGRREIIDYLISKGAKDWNYALRGAEFGGDKATIEYIKSKGATN
jgi:hypothetical protein